jgi:hypothetical protein
MTRLFLAAGVAALAITAPAASAPGGHGGHDRAQAQKSERQAQRGGGAKAQRAQAQRSERRASMRTARAERAQPRKAERAQQTRRADVRHAERARPSRVERVEQRQANRANRVERIDHRQANRANRVERIDRRQANRIERADRRQAVNRVERIEQRQANRLDRVDRRQAINLARETRIDRIANQRDRQLARLAESRVVRADEWNDLARRGVWLDGCPPGLAKKIVACMPPGQAKMLIGQPLSTLRERVALRELPDRLRYVYRDTDDYYYRYGNGYAYRIDRNDDLVSALLPLFGLGYTVGQPFPAAYNNYYMPTGLQAFYPSNPYSSYRYANGYVYDIDPYTGLIQDVDPMLGYGYGYGQMMPTTYSAYNVPYQYRPYYYDTSDAYYRYAPGASYQVDPQTSLITAVAALLGGGMTVGQPLPVGYSAYNVPYDYRATYYDTPNDWYRYSNGYVYRVDPTTQLVTAIVASALT